jgi:mannose-1-phosphate guanylyltransferase
MPSAIIMAGGLGTRFWPASRKDNPKQFLKLPGANSKSMLRDTAERIANIVRPEKIFVVTTAILADKAARELSFVPRHNIVVEPERRNTAPCVALAMSAIMSKYGPDEVVAVLPADHKIGDKGRYQEILGSLIRYVRANSVVATFGIRPTRPETGYGYIETGPCLHKETGLEIMAGIRFIEKPSLYNAQKYIESGSFLWNSGMFVLKTGTFMHICQNHLPELYAPMKFVYKHFNNPEKLKDIYCRLPKISFDQGIMEKLDYFVVAPGDFSWNDLGSWLALHESPARDSNGNTIVADLIGLNVQDSIIFGSTRQTLAAVGIKDLIVVVEDDVIMICPKDCHQSIKDLVEEVRRRGREDLL